MTGRLLAIEKELRRAVCAEDYEEVPRLLRKYGEAATELTPELPAPMRCHVLGVFEWTRLMLVASRASCAAQLNRLPVLTQYLAMPSESPGTVRFDA